MKKCHEPETDLDDITLMQAGKSQVTQDQHFTRGETLQGDVESQNLWHILNDLGSETVLVPSG